MSFNVNLGGGHRIVLPAIQGKKVFSTRYEARRLEALLSASPDRLIICHRWRNEVKWMPRLAVLEERLRRIQAGNSVPENGEDFALLEALRTAPLGTA